MKGSKPKNRKPSVAVSRRFSCSEAFNFSERIEKCSSYSKEEKRKVLWKGIDATPLPLFHCSKRVSSDKSGNESLSTLRKGVVETISLFKELEPFAWVDSILEQETGNFER